MSLDFYSLLKKKAAESPDDSAYTFLNNVQSPTTFTYHDLFQKSSRIASELIKEENHQRSVILLFPPGLDFIKALYGCLFSQSIAVPVAIPRPAQQQAFLKIVEDAGAKVILSEESMISKYGSLLPDKKWFNINDLFPVSDNVEEFTPPSPNDVAILQYTSGSTGNPKGVMVSYQNLNHNLEAIRDHFGINAKSVSFSWLPHYHDMGLIDGILQPLVSGCKTILTSPMKVIGRPEFWLDCITEYGVTHSGGPNFFYEICNQKVVQNKNWDLGSLEDLYISAEPVRIDTLRRFAKKFEPYGFSMERFTPGYGLAEGTLMVSCKQAGLPVATKKFDLGSYEIEATSLGRPISGMEIIIIDPDSHELKPEGEAGEICLKGDSVTLGYWNNQGETHKIFKTKIEDAEESYLRTGDLGIIQNQELFVVGRLKDTVIQNGLNYQAEDIEYGISKSHSSFRNDSCVVFSMETGIEEKLVVLIKVSPKHRDHISQMEMGVRKVLFDQFGLSKASINFISGPSFAKTTSGKIRRLENKSLYFENKFNLIEKSNQ